MWLAGSIPPQPQLGNPSPRCFRIPEHNAIVNRMGFNSCGIEDALPRLQAYHTRRQDGAADASKVTLPTSRPSCAKGCAAIICDGCNRAQLRSDQFLARHPVHMYLHPHAHLRLRVPAAGVIHQPGQEQGDTGQRCGLCGGCGEAATVCRCHRRQRLLAQHTRHA